MPPFASVAAAPADPGTVPSHPGATISAALLLPQERIPRLPLAAWTGELLSRLAKCRQTLRNPRDYTLAIAGVTNNAALVAAHEGLLQIARRLCEAQLHWQHRFSRRSRDDAIAGHGIQAWINLGRLDVLSGEWESALARFAPLAGAGGKRRIKLGTIWIDHTAWQVVTTSQPKFAELLDSAYIVDTLKALLLNRRFDEVLAFTPVTGTHHPGLSCFLQEASAIAACGLGDFDRALTITTEGERSTRGWERVVFRLRMAEVLECAGRTADAAAILGPAMQAARGASPVRRGELGPLHIANRIAYACREVGLNQEAVELAAGVLCGARTARDEVLEIESLRILAAEHGPWAEHLERLEATTAYRRYRSETSEAMSTTGGELYAQLAEVISPSAS